MKTKSLFYWLNTLLILVFILSGCSPDPDVADQQSNNAQNQLKTITITVTSDIPITAVPADMVGLNQLYLFTTGGMQRWFQRANAKFCCSEIKRFNFCLGVLY